MNIWETVKGWFAEEEPAPLALPMTDEKNIVVMTEPAPAPKPKRDPAALEVLRAQKEAERDRQNMLANRT